jgi:hypothetical protein
MAQQNQALANTKGNNALASTSQMSSVMILASLDLAVAVMKTELTKPEVQLWRELLQPYPATAIQWAFREYLKAAVFFPKPADIIALIDTWKRNERRRVEDEKKRADDEETARRRARGETFGWAQIVKQYKHIFDKMAMPEPEPTRRVIRKGAVEIEISSGRRQQLREQVEELKRARK